MFLVIIKFFSQFVEEEISKIKGNYKLENEKKPPNEYTPNK